MFDLQIENEGTVYQPLLEDGVDWTTERAGTPGKLTFKVIKDNIINFQEGNPVKFYVDNKPVFLGYVFTKKRTKEKLISVTAYDQLRYFKNKDTYIYKNKKASEILTMVANDFELNIGDVEDTGYLIPKRSEDNKTLFDIVQNALNETITNTGKMYVLYDDFGSLTLKNIENMVTEFVLDENNVSDMDYSTSIDSETYNRIKLLYKNEDGSREAITAFDSYTESKWGRLQYFESIDTREGAEAKAKALLSLYNNKTRSLTLKNCIGDLQIRAGCTVAVKLNLGDIEVSNYLVCDKVKHSFKHGEHLMDITLIGGVLNG